MNERVKVSLDSWLAKLQPEEVDTMLLRLNEEYDEICKEARKNERR